MADDRDQPSPSVVDYARPRPVKKSPTFELRVTLAIVIGVPMAAIGIFCLVFGVSLIVDLCHRLARKIYEEDITQAIFCPLLGLICIVAPVRWLRSLIREARRREYEPEDQ